MGNVSSNNHQQRGSYGSICDTEFSTTNHTAEVPMPVQPVYANAAVSISDFKKSPNAVLKESHGQPVAVLTNGRISGYYVSAETWESLAEYLEDMELGELVRSRQASKRIKVNLDDL
ncbi:MAG: prevent-host-death protein [Ewingella americana]|jgi:antitoxin StbD|nr:prevent-host-death protein [Ewingella americana]MCI1679831.1 prevent-host-death protein [Ewingella americana]MCI1855515.1 prevent-host-death protein [Ewingella americana]MCI1862991.1 prevent-host-death protein [Ewingella americana]MCI2140665.1 prevent-host-death protein [Ewingella americana]MCI2165815.1 prevent-host-death protein [Ewingella americana]